MLRAVFVVWFGSVTAVAQTPWSGDAAAQLAARISSLLQRRATVSLEFQSLATLAPSDSSSFRSALEEELKKAGLETAAPADFRLRVTVSEDARGLLFIAEAIQGNTRLMAWLPWSAPPRTEMKPRMRIEIQPVVQQSDPVLDLLLLDSGQTLLSLSPAKITTYRLTNDKWTFSGVATIPLARPPARDPRGRIESTPNGFHVNLPGTTCNGTASPDIKLTCVPGNDTFPISPRDPALNGRWVTDRNLLESDGVRGRFYAAGSGVLAMQEGRIQDRAGESIAGTENWGSDFAGIESSCGNSPVVISTRAGDRADHDEIQSYEVANGTVAPASAPAALPGPATALWPAETAGSATLVIHNSKTGNYEASRLRVVCTE